MTPNPYAAWGEEWKRLTRRQQLRIIEEMRVSTAKAFPLETITIERMLSGFFWGLQKLRTPPKRAETAPEGVRSGEVSTCEACVAAFPHNYEERAAALPPAEGAEA